MQRPTHPAAVLPARREHGSAGKGTRPDTAVESPTAARGARGFAPVRRPVSRPMRHPLGTSGGSAAWRKPPGAGGPQEEGHREVILVRPPGGQTEAAGRGGQGGRGE